MHPDLVLQELHKYVPWDSDDGAYKDQILKLLRTTPEPLSRSQFLPGHITVSAFVLDPTASALLIIHHKRLKSWFQPGGHVEPTDESLWATALREVHEETGIEAGHLKEGVGGIWDIDIHRIPARPLEPAHQHFDIRVLMQSSLTALRPGSDVMDGRWASLSSVHAISTDRSLLRAVERIHAQRSTAYRRE